MIRRIAISIIISFFISSAFFGSCRKIEPDENEIEIYGFLDTIINPPDSFMLVFSLNTLNYYSAEITFDTNSVWEVEKVTALSSIFWVQRKGNPDQKEYIDAESNIKWIGFEGNVEYEFWANTNNYPDPRKLFIHFEKQDIDYESFSPKL